MTVKCFPSLFVAFGGADFRPANRPATPSASARWRRPKSRGRQSRERMILSICIRRSAGSLHENSNNRLSRRSAKIHHNSNIVESRPGCDGLAPGTNHKRGQMNNKDATLPKHTPSIIRAVPSWSSGQNTLTWGVGAIPSSQRAWEGGVISEF
jgi:hypothetical protein